MKRLGAPAAATPAAAKPKPAPAPPTLSGAASVPVPASATSADALDPLGGVVSDAAVPMVSEPMTQGEMMALLRQDLATAMKEEMDTTVERIVNKAFGRLTDKIASVEAVSVRNARQLVEVRHEVAQQSTEVAQLRKSVDAMTAELSQLRLQGMPRGSEAASSSPAGPAPSASRLSAQTYTIHTPRSANQETAVLLIWPRKMVSDHYKALHPLILAKYMSDAEADEVIPNYPRSANRYGLTFKTHAAAARFLAAFRERPILL